MLIDLSQAVGNYLHDVFVAKFQWWVLLGYIAQVMFTMRFVVQWVASERAGNMVMPIAFWFFSIVGTWQRDVNGDRPTSAIPLIAARARSAMLQGETGALFSSCTCGRHR